MGVGRIAVFLAAAGVAGAAAGDARGSLFFLFEPTAAKPADVVTVRTGGTPKSFTLRQRVRPFQRPIRLYLVPNRLAPDVHNRFDRRAHFVGRLVPDRNGRGLLRFTVPPLDTDSYTAGAWCPGCAPYSRGHTWFAVQVNERTTAPRFRPLVLLRVRAQSAGKSCPVTLPNGNRPVGASPSADWHGNGLLWTSLPRYGVLAIPPSRVDDDGLFDKIGWLVAEITFARSLTVRGERLDRPAPPMKLLGVNGPGQSSLPTRFRGASMATPVVFPSEGCWKITGRVQDVSLSFVLKVVMSPTG